ncbi:MAG TPA: Sec-independent protein translocase protein TatB [Brevundimonas sp.]|nr:Sec-independent protein translocase protein TatB [Brevundimonas sp.]
MGGLGPGIGGGEYLIIAIVALLVVGPERLPLLLRKLGKMVSKARSMANEFRSNFDEMARQSELDDLRKEVEALRSGQGMHALGADADAAFRDIRDELNSPVNAVPAPPPQAMLGAPDEWPDSSPVMAPLEVSTEPAPSKPRKPRAKAASTTAAKPAARKPRASRPNKVDL